MIENITIKMPKIKYNTFLDKKEIELLYNKGLSGIKIANKLKIKPQYVYRFMVFNNIKRRTKQEALKNAYNKKIRVGTYSTNQGSNNIIKNITKNKLIELYINKNLTIKNVSKQLNISSPVISRLLKQYNINKLKSGKNNQNWKGGVMFDIKRKLIYKPNHPHHNFLKNYVYEYVLIMEKHIGRYLINGEVVHHIDSNVSNNQINNLQLCKNQSEHCKLHLKNKGGKNRYR